MRHHLRFFYIAILWTLWSATAAAQHHNNTSMPAIELTGEVVTPLRFTSLDLQQMERSTVSIPDRGNTGMREYEGVPLWRLLDQAGVSTEKLTAKDIAKGYFVVRGADGFEVVFSLAELDRAFSEKVVLLADRLNGQPLPTDRGPFQIVVQGDLRPTRNCYQVVALVVGEAKMTPK